MNPARLEVVAIVEHVTQWSHIMWCVYLYIKQTHKQDNIIPLMDPQQMDPVFLGERAIAPT